MRITLNNSIRVRIYQSLDEMSNGDALKNQDTRLKMEYNYFNSDLSSIFTQRLFVQGGAAVELFKKIEVGLEFKRGIGYRTVKGKTIGTNHVGGLLRLSYRL